MVRQRFGGSIRPIEKISVGPTEFWKVFADEASIFLDPAMVAKVLESRSKWEDVKQELPVLSQCSLTGDRLFNKAAICASSSEVSDLMIATTGILKTESMDRQKVLAVGNELQIAFTNMPDIDSISGKREVQIPYRKEMITMICRSFTEEWTARLQAAMKPDSSGQCRYACIVAGGSQGR